MPSNWMYDEFRHAGVDYADTQTADTYDEQHTRFRDYAKEFEEMLSFLDMTETADRTLIDLGCGTGALSVFAAEHFRHVYSVDVSEVMLAQLRKKAVAEKLDNISIIRGGFLGYVHEGEPVDLLVTKFAFHHLPDFWKQVALMNMHRMLRPGGCLYMADVIFTFPPAEYERRIGGWLDWFVNKTGEQFASEAATHLRDEYSTFSWIMNGMLERAGFTVKKQRSLDGFSTEYHCIRA